MSVTQAPGSLRHHDPRRGNASGHDCHPGSRFTCHPGSRFVLSPRFPFVRNRAGRRGPTTCGLVPRMAKPPEHGAKAIGEAERRGGGIVGDATTRAKRGAAQRAPWVGAPSRPSRRSRAIGRSQRATRRSVETGRPMSRALRVGPRTGEPQPTEPLHARCAAPRPRSHPRVATAVCADPAALARPRGSASSSPPQATAIVIASATRCIGLMCPSPPGSAPRSRCRPARRRRGQSRAPDRRTRTSTRRAHRRAASTAAIRRPCTRGS